MIHMQVEQWTEPINNFIYDHLYFILVIISILVLVRITKKIRGVILKRKADKMEASSTNEWFKI